MSQIDANISNHYLGEHGAAYFTSKFNTYMDFGRLFQSRYFLPYCSDDLILIDFGCADGLFLRNLPARCKIGVEANPTARQRCKDINENTMEPIEVYETLAGVQSNCADLVISNHCLEHVRNPFATLQEFLRVLKPGGRLALMVPFDDHRSAKNKTWSAQDPDNHLYTWSPMNLGNLLQEVGFDVQKVQLYTRAWSPKLFWIHRILGDRAFKIACYILGLYKNRREIFALCEK